MIKKQAKLLLGGRELVLETGELAFQAGAAVLIRYGGTVVLATVVASSPREDLDYFPLQVEYVERLYAGGRIKGSRWVKREGRPSDEAVLAARLVDRLVRPLFPEGFKNEVQIILTVLSVDHENDPAILGAIAASAALHLSEVPWQGPLGIVRVGFRDGHYFVNPTNSEMENSDLDLVVGLGLEGVVMLEGGANQLTESEFLGAIEFAQKEGKKLIKFIDDFRKEAGKKKLSFNQPEARTVKEIANLTEKEIVKLVEQLPEDIFDKLDVLVEDVKEKTEGIGANLIREVVAKIFKKKIRTKILAGERPDGRKPDQIRPINIRVGALPRTHGSAVFQRGKTQVLTVATLGPPSLRQWIESPEGEEIKRYIHHYYMPPYATGSTGKLGWPKRREIGHGALAERALLPVIPSEDKFPYTIRLVSEILSSNGSTSMASACGSSLALMDAGVPITDPVAGISIGLVKEGEKYILLTDIIGLEDFNGDMDFKVAGTEKGITAIQVDIKLKGLSLEIVKEALNRAREARLKILTEMLKVISQPRARVSQYAPKIAVLHVPVETIGNLIGPGGRTIRKLIDETDCVIDVEDDGTISITGMTEKSVAEAIERIEALTRRIEVGEEFEATVKRIEPFGAFVEFLPGKEGLIHISQMGVGFVKNVADILRVGQKVKVKVREIDDLGRVNFSLISPVKTLKRNFTRRHPRGFHPRVKSKYFR